MKVWGAITVVVGLAIIAIVQAPSASAQGCPNEPIRSQQAAVDLPDCRAYELVTPADTDGRLIEVISAFNFGIAADLFPLELASASHDGFLYMTYDGPLGSPEGGNGSFDVYEATRGLGGWTTTRHIGPPATSLLWPIPGGVSPDHGFAFVNEGGTDYLMNPDGSRELTGRGSLNEEPLAQGRYISEGGQHVIFSTGKDPFQSHWCNIDFAACEVRQLEPQAPEKGTGAIYDRSVGGSTHVVSLLPKDERPKAGEQAFYKGASKDASTVAFEIEGTLYVRVHNGEASAEKTLEVASGAPTFAGLSDSGQYLFYVSEGTIHRFSTTNGTNVAVNSVGQGEVVNISGDGSHVFFVSEQGLTGAEENERGETARLPASGAGTVTNGSSAVTGVVANEGEFAVGMAISGEGIPPRTTIVAVGPGTLTLSKSATASATESLVAGYPNLYVWSGGNPRYVTTVAVSDLVRTSGKLEGVPALANWTTWVTNPRLGSEQGPGAESSRTTSDGRFLVFESKGKLTSYESAGHTEIYRYDDETGDLDCVSCNPNMEPAVADARLQEVHLVGPPFVIHNVSEDGSRVFFETSESLTEGDTDGINDVYEWNKGAGGGSVALISSGKSSEYPLQPDPNDREKSPGYPFTPMSNVLLSVSPDGSDAFFTAKEALVSGAGEGGTEAIYDARINGGFPEAGGGSICTEESCRPTGTSSPFLASPASETISGPGNVKHHRRRCHRRSRKAKRKHCSRKHSKTHRARVSESSRSLTQSERNNAAPVPAAPVSSSSSGEDEGVGKSPRLSSGAETFGIELADAKSSTSIAGAHPDFVTHFVLNHHMENGHAEINATSESISISLPPGLLGNPTATPRCATGEFTALGNCPIDSQVGVSRVLVGNPLNREFIEPVYSLIPPHPNQQIARLGLIAGLFPVFIDIGVRSAGDYGVTAVVHDAPGQGALIEATTTLWGDPATATHDEERATPYEVVNCPIGRACLAPEEKRSSGIPTAERKAFMTNPAACQSGIVSFALTSYQYPGQVLEKSTQLSPVTECAGLPFAPSFEAEPTSHEAGAPTGLQTKLVLPQHLGPEERATATMREARVTLPAGMQLAAGAANWIGTCSEGQVGYHEEVDAACPDASKLGTATITSPDLPKSIEGTIYQRTPEPGHPFGLWLTSDALGLHIKLPGFLVPDPSSGRLTAVFSDLPQVPVEEIDLKIWGGPRAPLQNPDRCGTYTTDYSFAPHSEDPVVSGQSQMQITEGCNHGFSPTLRAGATEPVAGRFSPFVFDLTRGDGQQALGGFELHLPDGELAKLKGIPLCPDDAASAGSCPGESKIGELQASTGPGPEPLQIPQPGKLEPAIYLAGPYQGAPFSIVSEVPAQAGPFDLGTLAVRSELAVEPESGKAVVKADPLPQFFEGVGIAYRQLHAVIDRPEFSLNPTNCSELQVTSDVISTQGTVAHPSARFQVDGCKALRFKPKLSVKLRGGTERGGYPALTATLKARKRDANIARVSVALPHSEFLAQEHIVTVCTRVQFASDKCPKGSVYGRAKAWTPLLDKPLEGSVYLRSSSHPLPDIVVALRGQLEIDLVGRIDSHSGGIRTTFESVPDAPVTKFVLQMRGGKKSLLTNSTDICRGAHRATVRLQGQNGRVRNSRIPLTPGNCKNSN